MCQKISFRFWTKKVSYYSNARPATYCFVNVLLDRLGRANRRLFYFDNARLVAFHSVQRSTKQTPLS
jgi:hypothetical protein